MIPWFEESSLLIDGCVWCPLFETLEDDGKCSDIEDEDSEVGGTRLLTIAEN